jgi:hypothetical protein
MYATTNIRGYAWLASASASAGRTMSQANPKGYNFQVRVTSGHEAEAKSAEMAKKPNRLGMFILGLLGYKGKRESHQRGENP